MDSLVIWLRGALARWSDYIWAATLACVGVYLFSGYFTTVQFDRERIEVRVAKDRIQVKGFYHYANASRLPAVLTLKIPFPVDRGHPQPEWYALCEADERGRAVAEIAPVVRGNDISIRLIFGPREAKWIKLEYAQPALAPNGRYLLTTTRAWRRPIDQADFVLRLPHNFSLRGSSYPVAASREGSWKTYAFSKTSFFPAQDWVFAWDEPGVEAAMGR